MGGSSDGSKEGQRKSFVAESREKVVEVLAMFEVGKVGVKIGRYSVIAGVHPPTSEQYGATE